MSKTEAAMAVSQSLGIDKSKNGLDNMQHHRRIAVGATVKGKKISSSVIAVEDGATV